MITVTGDFFFKFKKMDDNHFNELLQDLKVLLLRDGIEFDYSIISTAYNSDKNYPCSLKTLCKITFEEKKCARTAASISSYVDEQIKKYCFDQYSHKEDVTIFSDEVGQIDYDFDYNFKYDFKNNVVKNDEPQLYIKKVGESRTLFIKKVE